jgi:ABC-type dipeptide/oligopeptide/nickel transport system permease subunit
MIAKVRYLYLPAVYSGKPGANILNIFTDIIYAFPRLARLLVLGKLFQPSLMFVSKPRRLS